MKRIKIMLLTILSLCGFLFVGCSFMNKEDVTLYHLEITANIDKVSQSDLKAVYAYGCNGATVEEGVRDEYDVEELKKSGATQEDIDKAGKRQEDGSYYFFDQDPVYLVAPEVEGYVFNGFYDKSNGQYLYKPLVDQTTSSLYKWNMPSKDITVEARYEVLKYNVVYCYGFERSIGFDDKPLPSGQIDAAHNTNPSAYNYETQKEVSLVSPTKEFAGYEFKYWYYTKLGSPEKIRLDNLPVEYNEDLIFFMGTDTQTNENIYSITLFAYYEPVTYHVSFSMFTCNEPSTCQVSLSIDGIVKVSANGEVVDTLSVTYNTGIDVWVDVSEIPCGYVFDGIYVNGLKVRDIEPGVPSNRDTVYITCDTLIEIKVIEE